MDSDSNEIHKMDTSYESFESDESLDNAIVPYSGGTLEEDESQESIASSSPFNTSDLVKLFVPRYNEVEIGYIVEACHQGECLGMYILKELWLFVLLCPHSIFVEAQSF